jgi:hypothetical protein
MLNLDQELRERHSTPMYLPQPVPRGSVNEALALCAVEFQHQDLPA